MTKRTLALACLLLIAAACNKPPVTNNQSLNKITIGTTELNIEIANTDVAREQGLSNRDSLAEDQGMLFDFKNTNIERPSFWMKGMRFNLDFLWIKANTVIAITEDVPAPKTPDEVLPSFQAPGPIDTMIEVNSGWVKRH
jgi:uncharacterized membrane protein (UPF0127 family)